MRRLWRPHRRGLSSHSRWVEIHPEVAEALRTKRGIVALESTILTHGLPSPVNLDVAKELGASVRDGGAVPATIAVLDGVVRVGLSAAQLERVCAAGDDAVKCSKRDIAAVAVASGRNRRIVGSTTVAATVAICGEVGIKVFATGGIGGVHIGAAETFDISADLVELGRYPVAVVCAGCKSVLDVKKTLEVLETHGVAVFGYTTDAFATFYSTSHFKAPHRMDEPADVAAWIAANDALKFHSGCVVAVPHTSSAEEEIDRAIAQALRECPKTGKEATPWLLRKVHDLTEGRSTEANVVLVKRNASIAAAIASEASPRSSSAAGHPLIVVAGTVSFDVVSFPNAGNNAHCHGGVARNIAEAAARAGADVAFVSAANSDILQHLTHLGVDCAGSHFVDDVPTYVAILREEEEPAITYEQFDALGDDYQRAQLGAVRAFFFRDSEKDDSPRRRRIVVVDADLPNEGLDIIRDSITDEDELWLDPTMTQKAPRLNRLLDAASVCFPNKHEVIAMASNRWPERSFDDDLAAAVTLATETQTTFVVTRGTDGVVLVRPDGTTTSLEPERIVPPSPPANAVGAGDTLLGIALAAYVRIFDLHPDSLPTALRLGMRAAELTAASSKTVHPAISPTWLDDAAFHFAVSSNGQHRHDHSS